MEKAVALENIEKAKSALSFHLMLKVANLATNIAVARAVSPGVFGHANISLLLLNTLVLHLTRECFRRVAQQEPQNAGRIMTLGTLSAWLIAPIAWNFWPTTDSTATALICVAACVEAAAEPLYAPHLVAMEMKYRALAEGLGLTFRGVAILLTASQGLTAFAIGQLAYACTVLVVYSLFAKESPRRYLRMPLENEAWGLLKAGFAIAALKFVLSEGEKLVLMLFETEKEQQGVYALVAGIGSIVTRNLFQPIEETTYGLFSKLKGAPESAQVATSLIKLMWVLGLGAVVYCQILSSAFIRILYGAQWLDAGADLALRYYSVYIFLMALYGVTDAVGFAQSSREELHKREKVMVGFSLIYISASIGLVARGAVGVIASNCLSYLCRLAYAVRLLRRQMRLEWRDLLPEKWTAVSFAVVAALSLLGPLSAAALAVHLPVLWKCNKQFLLKAKRD